MPAEWYQYVGLIVKELTPSMVAMYQTSQNEKSLTKRHQIEEETYERMSSSLTPSTFHERFNPKVPCKSCSIEAPGKRELYRQVWAHLESLPRAIPEKPSAEERQKMEAYVASVVTNIPCQDCADHAKAYVAMNPVDASSPEALSRWVCRYRNEIRASKGQPVTHPCE